MSGFGGGVDLPAAATVPGGSTSRPSVANISEHVDSKAKPGVVHLKTSGMPCLDVPGTVSQMVNGPHTQQQHMFDDTIADSKTTPNMPKNAEDGGKSSASDPLPNSHLENSQSENKASSNEHLGHFQNDRCLNSDNMYVHVDEQISQHAQLASNCGNHVAEIWARKGTDVLSDTDLKMNVKIEPTTKPVLANGACRCLVNMSTGKLLNSEEKTDTNTSSFRKSCKHGRPNTKHHKEVNKKDLTCSCIVNKYNSNEPLASLSKMVKNVCLESENSREFGCTSSMEKLKLDSSQDELPCADNGAVSGDLLAGIDQSFGAIGPAGADLNETELEELPSSLSDFVLGCHDNQYAVPPFPANDSDIDTIRIEPGPDCDPITLVPYESEVQMPDIMRLITKDLSEPYSIYTYRYFIHNWPQLCFLAMHQDKCVGAIVCKLDIHKKMARRGYIAMLAVDENYRKRQIGSSLVKKAIRAMVRGDCDEVVLETEITNKPALRLYENLGFLRDKRLFRYYLNGVDALRLKLWLREGVLVFALVAHQRPSPQGDQGSYMYAVSFPYKDTVLI